MQHKSSESKNHNIIAKFIDIVATNHTINEWKVVRQIGMTPKQYESMKNLLIQGYDDVLDYNKNTKEYTIISKPIEKPIVEEEEIEIEDEGIIEEKIKLK